MSLAQHVSAAEGVDRELDGDIDVSSLILTKALSHKLSYDILPHHPQNISTSGQLEGVAAYEVSSVKRLAQVVVGCLTCVLAAGITFGFAALKYILVEEKVYRHLCTQKELDQDVRICYLQDQRLNLTFIVASVTANMGALIVGTVLDRCGPRVCGLISSALLVIGTLCMAFSQSLPLDAFMSGSFFLALGGCFSFVPSFHLSNAFPRFQGLILALVTGSFDASAAVFLVFRLAYDKTDGFFGLRSFFLLYLIVPTFILVTQLLLMPVKSYDTRTELNIKLEIAEDPGNDIHDSDDELETDAEMWKVRAERSIQRKSSIASIRQVLGTEEQRDQFEKKEEDIKIASGVWGVLHGISAWKQIQTPWFVLITMLTVLQMARFNFFIATIWTQYQYMLQSSQLATQVNELFDLALPLGGVLTVPFIGLLLDNLSTITVLALIVLMSTVIGALGAIPTLTAAYWNICFFVIFRPLYYSAMSDYAAKIFGFQTFGTVCGTIICLSGIAVFSQSGLQALVHNIYYEDPGPVNLWLAGLGLIVGVCLVMYVDLRGRQIRLEHTIETERRSLGIRSRRPSKSSLVDLERRPLLHRGLSTVQEREDEPDDEMSQLSDAFRGQ